MSKHLQVYLLTFTFMLSIGIFHCREKQTEPIQIIIEVDMKDVLNSLASKKDESFEKALEMVAEERRHTDADQISMLAIKLEEMDVDIAKYYGTRLLRNKDEILTFLHKQSDHAVDQSVAVLQDRIKQFGVSKFSIQKQLNNRVIIKLAGITDSQRVREILVKTALLEFRLLKDRQITQDVASRINEFMKGEISDMDTCEKEEPGDTSVIRPEELFGETEENAADTMEKDSLTLVRERLFKENLFFAYPGDPQRLLVPIENEIRLKLILVDPAIQNIIQTEGGDAEFMWGKIDPEGEYFGLFLIEKEAVMTGETITNAFPQPGSGYDPGSVGKFEVSLTFNDQGARIFSRITGANLNKRLAIILDRKVHSAPTIQAKIRDGRARITGLETMEEAHDLSIVLKAGALPYRLTVVEEKILKPNM